jgi:hypothetical protein
MEACYEALQAKEASYRINYDYLNNTEEFEVWQGRDLTPDNTDGNNPIIFSVNFKNLRIQMLLLITVIIRITVSSNQKSTDIHGRKQ